MKLGNVSIITLNDGSTRYKASISRDKKVYRATFDTEKEARKWLKKTHYKWLDNKIANKLKSSELSNLVNNEDRTFFLSSEDEETLEHRIDVLYLELKELSNKIERIFNTILLSDL